MFDRLVRFDPLSGKDLSTKTAFAALMLRLGLAAIFIYHGLEKILPTGSLWGANWMAEMLAHRPRLVPDALQISALELAVAWGELAGGIALALGLLTRLAAIGMILIQAGAIYVLGLVNVPFSSLEGGYAFNVLLIVVCVALVDLGSGAFSLDRLMTRESMTPHPSAAPPPQVPLTVGP